MANWYGAWRTNYVKLRADRIEYLERFEVTLPLGVNGTVAILSDSENGEPQYYLDGTLEEENLPAWLAKYVEDDCYLDLGLCIHEFLEEGEVIVIQCSGAEKLRYITGYATAIHSSGKSVEVSINDIYAKAKESFGKEDISEATY